MKIDSPSNSHLLWLPPQSMDARMHAQHDRALNRDRASMAFVALLLLGLEWYRDYASAWGSLWFFTALLAPVILWQTGACWRARRGGSSKFKAQSSREVPI